MSIVARSAPRLPTGRRFGAFRRSTAALNTWYQLTDAAGLHLVPPTSPEAQARLQDLPGGYNFGNSTPLQIARRQMIADLNLFDRDVDSQTADGKWLRQKDAGWVSEATGEKIEPTTVEMLAGWLDEHVEWCFRTDMLFKQLNNYTRNEANAFVWEKYDCDNRRSRALVGHTGLPDDDKETGRRLYDKVVLERRVSTAATKPGHYTVYINHHRVEVPKGQVNMVEICAMFGVNIPVYCYHPRLPIAGNCRMCMVQIATAPNPVVACAMPAMPYMSIFTDTRLVREAREGNVELMILNHPLDCPICDQAGECELQDISLVFGGGGANGSFIRFESQAGLDSRNFEGKGAFEDKFLNPFIITSFNRCIQCTRCTRFLQEVALDCSLGMVGRGPACEISTYHSFWEVETELSGNIADLCPVGALTAVKHYASTDIAVAEAS